jgi:DNA-binding transcriptional LysR family regulator
VKIQTLKYLIALSEAKSINAAARKLFISQPSLTKSIHLMENELGLKLFVRTKAGIHLTEAGQKIVSDARGIVKTYDSWLAYAQHMPLPPIKIYGHISFSDFLLPEVVLQIKEQYPNRSISYRSIAYPDQYISPDFSPISIVMTVCDELSKVVLAKAQGNQPITLLTGEYQCLVSCQSELAKKQRVTLEDLKSMYLMLPDSIDEFLVDGSFLKPIMSTIVRSVSADHVVEVDTLQNVIDAVRNNSRSYAVSFYPALVRYQASGRKLTHIPYEGLKTKGSLCLFYPEMAAKKYPIINTIVSIIVKSVARFTNQVTDKEKTV